MANHRKPQPHQCPSPPVPRRACKEVRPTHVPPLQLPPHRCGLLRRHGQVLPQDPRPHLRGPPQERRDGIHILQLLRHPVGTLRLLLASWHLGHRLCATELFSSKRLDSFKYIRTEEVRNLIRNLFESSGQPIVVKDYLSTTSLNTISRMVLGMNYFVKSDADARTVVTPEELKWMLDEFFVLNGVINIGDLIPWLNFLDLQGYIKRLKRLSKMFDQFLEHVIEEHNERRRRDGEGFVAKNIVDLLLLLLADDANLEVELTRDGVKAFTLDFIAGGTETFVEVVEWAMSELLKRPDVLAKATEELHHIIGTDRWVEEINLAHLPYIEALLKESMRLHPPNPLLRPRLSREHTTVDGYDIPAGTRVMINIWTVSRDPKIWDAMEKFQPERFIGSPIDFRGQDFEFVPFGSGRRMCPGYALGLVLVQLSLANLVHGFAWKLPQGMKEEELNIEERFGMSLPRKVRLGAVVEPKLPAYLYGV